MRTFILILSALFTFGNAISQVDSSRTEYQLVVSKKDNAEKTHKMRNDFSIRVWTNDGKIFKTTEDYTITETGITFKSGETILCKDIKKITGTFELNRGSLFAGSFLTTAGVTLFSLCIYGIFRSINDPQAENIISALLFVIVSPAAISMTVPGFYMLSNRRSFSSQNWEYTCIRL